MLHRKNFLRTSWMAMHWRAQEFRCSTNFMSISPARRVNLTARSSAKVQPFPPQPVVIASLQTAATFSRSDFCLIFSKLGKSFAISLTPQVFSWIVAMLSSLLQPIFLRPGRGSLDYFSRFQIKLHRFSVPIDVSWEFALQSLV